MRARQCLLAGVLLLAVVLSLATITAAAQSGGQFSLEWQCAGCGGGTASGGPYVLFGSAGQPLAGAAMTGGGYSLESGFLAYGDDSSVYLPLTFGRR